MGQKIEINHTTLIAELAGEVRINGVWVDGQEAEKQGFPLREDSGETHRLSVRNDSGKTVRLGGFRWRHTGHHGDFLDVSGNDIVLYVEGWTMASPCGARRYGDSEFRYNPDYMRFAVCAPEECKTEPNHFHAEHALAVCNEKTGNILLAGFVTSAHQFGRFLITLDEHGVSELSIISDCDDRELDPSETAESEELMFFSGTDLPRLMNLFADLWGWKMNARQRFSPPLGWCSWYYYFEKVQENDVLENVRWFAAHKETFPVEYIQLDDGYQSALGDWLVCNGKFPHGLAFLAQEIRKAGFKPALWLAPFLVEENSDLLKEHPEWMVCGENGVPCFPAGWRENHKAAILDGTHPDVQEHFRTLFRTLRKWGFEYVKLDFMVQETARGNGHYHDRKATRAEALRRRLEAIREGFGEDGFILGCTVPFGPAAGVVDGERISTDITPYWAAPGETFDEAPTVPNVCRNIIHHTYLNHRLWINDPDTHIARTDNNKLTGSEVVLWTNAVRLSGGMLLFSDRFETLSSDRALLSESLIADQDQYVSHPVDALRNRVPQIWFGTHKKTGEQLLGVFNFDDSAKEIELLPDDFKCALMLTEKETGTQFMLKNVPVRIPAAPHSSRLFAVEPEK